MADEKTYDVHRSMFGDKEYHLGDTRKMSAADAAPLLESGALSEHGKEPATREPAVRHTFGAEKPTGHLTSTLAIGDKEPVVPGANPVVIPDVAKPTSPKRSTGK